MILTKEDEKKFKESKNCHLCLKELDNDRVRDHDHLNGEYRGAAHKDCNLKCNHKNYNLPVIFHNSKGYDSHFIFQYAGLLGRKINVIPLTDEKYLSFTIDRTVFLDSYQFTLASLENLVNGMNKAEDKNLFKNFNEGFK